MANPKHLKILKQGVGAWNRWRREKPDYRPHLSGASLEGADLAEVNLKGAALANADFFRADLSGADFRGAELVSADLRGAKAIEADFRGANLRECNLQNAFLIRTNFQEAELQGADFGHAILGHTQFGSVNLKGVLGLSDARHSAASMIGVDSLYRSEGNVPDVFLRGTGIPEEFIQHSRGLFGSAIRFYSSFISYSHSNKSFARRLHDQLQARGIRCWLDEHDLKPGDRILDVVNDAIRLHDKILLCCSEASLESWWVKDEIDKALERERREGHDIIIPLNLDGYLLAAWKSGQASTIRSRLAADFTGWEHDNDKFEEEFERVLKALRMGASARDATD